MGAERDRPRGENRGERADSGFATVTHARLRAAQGDVVGARGILKAILTDRPGDAEASRLLERLGSASARLAPPEDEDEALKPPEPGDPRSLAGRFAEALGKTSRIAERPTPNQRVVRRLESLLGRVKLARGGEHVR